MNEITININVGEEDYHKGVKVKKRKLKNGKETVLKLPESVEGTRQNPNILDMMGM